MLDFKDIISQAKAALEEGMPDKALTILDILSNDLDPDILFLKGEIYFKLQRWGEALNQFSAYLEQFPSDQKAETYCVMIRNILGFYHKDLYNP